LTGLERLDIMGGPSSGEELRMPQPAALAPWTDVRDIILGWFERSFGAEFAAFKLAIADADRTRAYSLLSPDAVGAILEGDPRLDARLYVRGRYDCEDFAMAARSGVTFACVRGADARYRLPVAFGVLFTATHALNIGIAPDRQPYLYDAYEKRVWKEETLDDSLQYLPDLGTGWLKAVDYALL
jgi:hypothetical protein